MNKTNIKDLTFEELKKALSELGEPAYRARQIFQWLFKKGTRSFNDITSLSKTLRDELDKRYYLDAVKLSKHLTSKDETEKFLFELSDGKFVETVLILAGDRKTACMSTQVGCKFACAFCASGKEGFTRNLTPSEITGQVLFLRHELGHKIDNYVFMGMGEPLDNLENVIVALEAMNSPDGMGIAARRITVSTSGIIPGIEKLKGLDVRVNLSVSIHATTNETRNALMPVNKLYPLEKLTGACEDYANKTGRMITLEYIMIENLNDSTRDASRLAKIAKHLDAKVNLIAYSPVPGYDFHAAPKERIKAFAKALAEKKVKSTLRESKGADISAACGQLACG